MSVFFLVLIQAVWRACRKRIVRARATPFGVEFFSAVDVLQAYNLSEVKG